MENLTDFRLVGLINSVDPEGKFDYWLVCSPSFLSLGLAIYHLTEKTKSRRTFGVSMFSSKGIGYLKHTRNNVNIKRY